MQKTSTSSIFGWIMTLAIVVLLVMYYSNSQNQTIKNVTLTQNVPPVDPTRTVPSLTVPEGYTVVKNYQYQALGPGKDINGIKYIIPASMATGTNLATDTYISLEQIPMTASTTCSASLFTFQHVKPISRVDLGIKYSFASSSDAAAGNRYEESIYATPVNAMCVAVRYFIHYGSFSNYPKGVVKEFDKKALITAFDQIRRTLIVK
ncbi:MAG: hypothetical protein WCG97_00025 [bacterium]